MNQQKTMLAILETMLQSKRQSANLRLNLRDRARDLSELYE